mgnify:CR=1 FL=1
MEYVIVWLAILLCLTFGLAVRNAAIIDDLRRKLKEQEGRPNAPTLIRAGQMVYGRYNSVTQKWELITDSEDEAS